MMREETNKEPLNFDYDSERDVLTIEGVKYAGEYFRFLGHSPAPGVIFKIVERKDGVISVAAVVPDED